MGYQLSLHQFQGQLRLMKCMGTAAINCSLQIALYRCTSMDLNNERERRISSTRSMQAQRAMFTQMLHEQAQNPVQQPTVPPAAGTELRLLQPSCTP
jgi:hypothetical protein